MTPLRVGLVGSGPWAELAVAPALAAAPEVELTHGWSRNETALRALAGRHDFEMVRTFADLLASVDVVAFCVPPDVQANLTPAALGAGKALLLEKPVARSVEEAARLHDHTAAVLVHYSRLLDVNVAPWLDAAAQQRWSRATVVLTNSATLGGDPFGRSPWRRDDEGALWDLGPHSLAALQVVLGDVTSLSAHRRGGGVVLETEHSGGAMAQTLVSVASTRVEETFELVDAEGRVHRLASTMRQGGAETYGNLVSLLAAAAPIDPRRRCATAVTSPPFSTAVVTALASASRSLRS